VGMVYIVKRRKRITAKSNVNYLNTENASLIIIMLIYYKGIIEETNEHHHEPNTLHIVLYP
jgi:hypothetical protein